MPPSCSCGPQLSELRQQTKSAIGVLKIKQKEVMAVPASLHITPPTSAPRYRKWWTQQRKGHYHLKLQSTGQRYLCIAFSPPLRLRGSSSVRELLRESTFPSACLDHWSPGHVSLRARPVFLSLWDKGDWVEKTELFPGSLTITESH